MAGKDTAIRPLGYDTTTMSYTIGNDPYTALPHHPWSSTMTRTVSRLVLLAFVAACATEPDAPVPAGAPGDESALSTTTAPACWLSGATTTLEAAERPSPLDSTSATLGAGTVKVCYGAPSARGRTIIGGLDPYGTAWRMGANEATTFHTTVPLMFGEVALAAGSYSLFAIPTETEWTVVVNRQAERWGVPIGDEVRANDIGQMTIMTEPTDPPIETLRYRFESRADEGVDLLMEFEATRLRVPIRPAS